MKNVSNNVDWNVWQNVFATHGWNKVSRSVEIHVLRDVLGNVHTNVKNNVKNNVMTTNPTSPKIQRAFELL